MSISKVFQTNFPHKSVLSLSNAIVGASVLSMPYCFQQVCFISLVSKTSRLSFSVASF